MFSAAESILHQEQVRNGSADEIGGERGSSQRSEERLTEKVNPKGEGNAESMSPHHEVQGPSRSTTTPMSIASLPMTLALVRRVTRPSH